MSIQENKKVFNRVKKFLFAVILVSFIPFSIYANPQILGLSMDPPNPGFGESALVRITYCAQGYNDATIAMAVSINPTATNANVSGAGQVFVLYGNRTVNCQNMLPPNSTPGDAYADAQIGCRANIQPGNSVWDCTHCAGPQGVTYYREYTVRIPTADNFPGCSNDRLYLHVGMKDQQLAESEWVTRGTDPCTSETLSWNIPLFDPDFTVNKKVEGVLQQVGDLMVYSIDYSYQNGQLVITDTLPTPPGGGALRIVSIGPVPFSGAAPGDMLPRTITWTLPDRTGETGKAEGTVWVLLEMTTEIPAGLRLENNATGTMGSTTKNTSADIVVGEAAVNIAKSQNLDSIPIGDTATYFLEYDINGSKLIVYEPFDNVNSVTYTATAPTGWAIAAPGGTGNGWYIMDQCGTGDRIIRGSSNAFVYPGLIHTSPNDFCTGTIVTDVMIGASYEGADSYVFIRNNNLGGTAQSVAYGVVLSVDNFIGSNDDGELGFQRCSGEPASCIWPASTQPRYNIETNRWYILKAEAVSDYQFRAKVWPKGEPEPAGWDLTWTDTAPPANSSCASGNWYVGIAQQGGDQYWVNDYYNNFMVYEPRAINDPISIVDDYPETQLTSQTGWASGPHAGTHSGGQWNWNFSVTGDEAGTLTWWGRVTSCDPVTNVASITGLGVTQDSNEVVLEPICPDPEVSLTKTAQPTSARVGDTITYTIAYTNVGTVDVDTFYVWDTIPQTPPATLMALNTGSGTQTGNLIVWNQGPLSVGASGSVSWTAVIMSIPYLPMFDKEYLGYLIDRYTFGTERKGS